MALALSPGRWERLRTFLPAEPWPNAAEAAGGSESDRKRRLGSFAQLVRGERETARSPEQVTLSRSELRILDWHPPHLAFLRRKR